MPLGPVYYTGRDLALSSVRFGFHVDGESVSGISYQLTRPQFDDRDQILSPQAVTNELGSPDAIWVSLAMGLEAIVPSQTAFSLYLFYQPYGALIRYAGVAILNQDEYHLCMSSAINEGESYVESVSLFVGSRGSSGPEDLVAPFGLFGGMLESQEALGLSPIEMYTSFQNESTSCFKTPLSAWVTQP